MSLVPRQEQTDEYYEALRKQMGRTIWAAGWRSWYIDLDRRVATFLVPEMYLKGSWKIKGWSILIFSRAKKSLCDYGCRIWAS